MYREETRVRCRHQPCEGLDPPALTYRSTANTTMLATARGLCRHRHFRHSTATPYVAPTTPIINSRRQSSRYQIVWWLHVPPLSAQGISARGENAVDSTQRRIFRPTLRRRPVPSVPRPVQRWMRRGAAVGVLERQDKGHRNVKKVGRMTEQQSRRVGSHGTIRRARSWFNCCFGALLKR